MLFDFDGLDLAEDLTVPRSGEVQECCLGSTTPPVSSQVASESSLTNYMMPCVTGTEIAGTEIAVLESKTSLTLQSGDATPACSIRPYASADKDELEALERIIGTETAALESKTSLSLQCGDPAPACRIRPYASEDKDELGALEHACFGSDAKTLFEWIRCSGVSTPTTFIEVAIECEGALVGYVAWSCQEPKGRPPYISILSIAVLETCRGQRVGEQLLKEVKAKSLERFQKIERMRLQVRSDNWSALCLYHRFGFRKIAVLVGFYGDCDGVEMMCDLGIMLHRHSADPELASILCSMGFEEAEAQRALHWMHGDVGAAVALLTGDVPTIQVVRIPVRDQPSKWHRCAQCGTSRNLEYNPVGRYCTLWDGRLYCTHCWKSWA